MLRLQLSREVQDTLTRHEREGTTESAEYEGAVEVFYARFMCRVDPMPEEIQASFAGLKKDNTVYMTMYALEFLFFSPLKEKNGALSNFGILQERPVGIPRHGLS